jgi:AcrR family transcriptional regulator
LIAKRAYDETAKEARRQAILDAADRLFAEASDGLPSAAEIAEAAGLAKGTVYLYFDTKEDIFAALLLEGWGRAMDALEESFVEAGRSREALPVFLSRFVAMMKGRPNLMRLDAYDNGMLERKMTSAAVIAFKTAFLARLERVGAVLDDALGLNAGSGLKLLARSHAITRGLWQTVGSPAGAESAANSLDAFAEELLETLTHYWRGALSEASAGEAPRL